METKLARVRDPSSATRIYERMRHFYVFLFPERTLSCAICSQCFGASIHLWHLYWRSMVRMIPHSQIIAVYTHYSVLDQCVHPSSSVPLCFGSAQLFLHHNIRELPPILERQLSSIPSPFLGLKLTHACLCTTSSSLPFFANSSSASRHDESFSGSHHRSWFAGMTLFRLTSISLHDDVPFISSDNLGAHGLVHLFPKQMQRQRRMYIQRPRFLEARVPTPRAPQSQPGASLSAASWRLRHASRPH